MSEYTETFTITGHVCRVCGTEVLRDEETLAEVHRDVTYDAACKEIRQGRTETETVAAALHSIDQTGSLGDFRRGLNG